jgi:hypothetical protein
MAGIPVSALSDALARGDAITPSRAAGLIFEVPLAVLIVREVLRAANPPELRADVVVLAPGPPDGMGLFIDWIRLLVGAWIVSWSFVFADGTWSELLHTTGSSSPLIDLGGLVLGAAAFTIGLAIALAERRTTYLIGQRRFLVEGAAHDAAVSPLVYFFLPAMVVQALRYLLPRKIEAARVLGISVHMLTVTGRGGTTRWFTPVVMLSGGELLRGGTRSGSSSEATRQAEESAARAGLVFIRNPKVSG